jgi:hypothetical protein
MALSGEDQQLFRDAASELLAMREWGELERQRFTEEFGDPLKDPKAARVFLKATMQGKHFARANELAAIVLGIFRRNPGLPPIRFRGTIFALGLQEGGRLLTITVHPESDLETVE